jgi:hypothetical protein
MSRVEVGGGYDNDDLSMDNDDRILTPQQLANYQGVPLPPCTRGGIWVTGPTGFRVGKHLSY